MHIVYDVEDGDRSPGVLRRRISFSGIMSSDRSSPIAMSFQRRADPGAGVSHVADMLVLIWQDIERELLPIIGARGIAALHGRSLFLASRTHTWFGNSHAGVKTTMDLDSLHASLVARSAEEAVDGGRVLLQSFDALLTDMVGAVLTERLLRKVWDLPSSGSAAQDMTA